jgi:hypothetical protein
MRSELERALRSESASAQATARCEEEKAEMTDRLRREAESRESLLAEAKSEKQRAEANATTAADEVTVLREENVALSAELQKCKQSRAEASEARSEAQQSAVEEKRVLQETISKKEQELALLAQQKAQMEGELARAKEAAKEAEKKVERAQREAGEATLIERERNVLLSQEKLDAERRAADDLSRVRFEYEERVKSAIREKEECRREQEAMKKREERLSAESLAIENQLSDQGSAIAEAEAKIGELHRQLDDAVREKERANLDVAAKQADLVECTRKLDAGVRSKKDDERRISQLEQETERLRRDAEEAREAKRRLEVLERNLKAEIENEIRRDKEALRAEMAQYALLAYWTGSEEEIDAIAREKEASEAQFGSRIAVYEETAEAMRDKAERFGWLGRAKADLRAKCSMIRRDGQPCAECADLDGKTLAATIKRIARHARKLHGESGETKTGASAFLRESREELARRLRSVSPGEADAEEYHDARYDSDSDAEFFDSSDGDVGEEASKERGKERGPHPVLALAAAYSLSRKKLAMLSTDFPHERESIDTWKVLANRAGSMFHSWTDQDPSAISEDGALRIFRATLSASTDEVREVRKKMTGWIAKSEGKDEEEKRRLSTLVVDIINEAIIEMNAFPALRPNRRQYDPASRSFSTNPLWDISALYSEATEFQQRIVKTTQNMAPLQMQQRKKDLYEEHRQSNNTRYEPYIWSRIGFFKYELENAMRSEQVFHERVEKDNRRWRREVEQRRRKEEEERSLEEALRQARAIVAEEQKGKSFLPKQLAGWFL